MSSFSMTGGDDGVLTSPLQRRPPNKLHAGVTPKAGGQFFYDDDAESPVRRQPNTLNAGQTPRAASGPASAGFHDEEEGHVEDDDFNHETRLDTGSGGGGAAAGGGAPKQKHASLRRKKSFEHRRLEIQLHADDRFEREAAQKQLKELAEAEEAEQAAAMERAKLGRSLTRGGSMHRRGAAHKDHGHVSARSTMVKILHHSHDHHHYPYTIEPYNKYRRRFDVVTVLFVLYLAWKIPFAAGLNWYVTSPPNKAFEYFLDAWFLLDICLNFRTGFVHDGHVVMDPKEIAKHYFHFWFWIDVLASIPFELFADFIPNKTARKSIKLVKYFKIPRLLRLGRMLKYLRKWAKYYGLLVVCLGYFLSIHMFGCLWVSNAGICEHEDELHVNNDPKEPYLDPDYAGECSQEHHWIFHWYGKALQMGFTMLLGGSPLPVMGAEQRAGAVDYEYDQLAMAIFSGVVMSFGVFFVGAFTAQLTVIVMNTNTTVWEHRRNHNEVKREMAAHHLPAVIQHRVRNYLDYLWINRESLAESAILKDERLSTGLRNDIALHFYEDVVMNVSWLRFADEDLVAKICMNLKTQVFMPGDYMFHAGDIGRQLFIVKKGVAEVVEDEDGDDGKVLARVDKGGVFGEIALLHKADGKRLKSVRAGEFPCEVVTLAKKKFDVIRKEYPQFDEKMKEIATRHNRGSVFTSVNTMSDIGKFASEYTMVGGKRVRQAIGGGVDSAELLSAIDDRLQEHTEEMDAKLDAILKAVGGGGEAE